MPDGAKVTVEGAQALEGSLGAAEHDLGTLHGAHEQAAHQVATTAQGLTPVRTGQLRASIWGTTTAAGATVTAGAPYAGYVHAHTPFLTRALEQSRGAVLGVYAEQVAAVVDTIHGK